MGVCAFLSSVRSLELVPSKWRCLSPPPAGNASRWATQKRNTFGGNASEETHTMHPYKYSSFLQSLLGASWALSWKPNAILLVRSCGANCVFSETPTASAPHQLCSVMQEDLARHLFSTLLFMVLVSPVLSVESFFSSQVGFRLYQVGRSSSFSFAKVL